MLAKIFKNDAAADELTEARGIEEAEGRLAKLQSELVAANAAHASACREAKANNRDHETQRQIRCRQQVEKVEVEINAARGTLDALRTDRRSLPMRVEQRATLGAAALASLTKPGELQSAEDELSLLRDQRVTASAEHTAACQAAMKLGAQSETATMVERRKQVEALDEKIATGRARLAAARRDFQPAYTRAVQSVEAAYRVELAAMIARAAAIGTDLQSIARFAESNGLEVSNVARKARVITDTISDISSRISI